MVIPFLSAERESSCMREDNYREKYEQSVNMPKNFRKSAVIRKFRQIPAKTGLESQCLCGFPEGTVEMEEARLGR